MRAVFKKFMDENTVLHRWISYGFTMLLILATAYFTPGQEKLASNAGTWVVLFILFYTLLTRRILETLIFANVLGLAMIHGFGFIDGFKEQLFKTMSGEDFIWIVLLCCSLNVFNKFLNKTGALGAFAGVIKSRVKSEKQLNMATWLLQFPLFFDDYMTMAIGGSIMAPMYDEMKVPREEGAYLIHTLAEPLRVLFPITSWAAFMSGCFISTGIVSESEGMMAFIRSIPFNFYAMISIVGTFLFAAGILPKIGGLKKPDPSQYIEFAEAEDVSEDKKKGTLWDFFIPIVFLVVMFFYFNFDTVSSMVVVIPVTVGYYLLRGIMGASDVEECLVSGFSEFMSLIILFCASYMLNDVLTGLGYIDYLAETVRQFVNPNLLPVLVFVVFCISECIMSLNWGLILITFPILVPVAAAIGANPYMVAAAIVSAGCFGCNMCYICDYTMLSSSVFGLKAGYHASTCVPYSIIFAVITAVFYLIAGFIF